ncbi:MAG: universal stress protein [Shinella zoogloeoides]|uniref:universal stress protein n=1 Tax=Shinella zoogloeoides TaxID=352475 RepID=UPI003C7205C2
MVYRSILVNLDIDRPVEPLTQAAIDLASRSGARLIGLCAARTPAERMEEVRAAFLHLAANRIEAEWRGETMTPTEAVVAAARVADLVLMAAGDRADPAAVVLRTGRPLLVVGSDCDTIATRKIVIGWKDTREARRAIADALPLLSVAYDVAVVSVSPEPAPAERQSLSDIVSYLARHNVKARPQMIKSADETIGFLQFVDESDADIVVTGAYGHSRLREWVFGGITGLLLEENTRTRFLSC